MNEKFLAIVNPAAGGGRSAKLAGEELARLKGKGLRVDVIASTGPGHVAELAGEAYSQGYRHFLAVGGDGTAHEIINGVFSHKENTQRIGLGFLPLGRGNSFLRDFSEHGAEASLDALENGRKRRVDLLRLTHAAGTIYFDKVDDADIRSVWDSPRTSALSPTACSSDSATSATC